MAYRKISSRSLVIYLHLFFINSSVNGSGIHILTFYREKRDEPHLFHDLHFALHHIIGRILRGELTGIGKCGGYQGTVRTRQFRRLTAKMLFGNSLYTIDTVAHLDAVEIDLHDALLAPNELYQYREIGFKTLAHPRTPRPQEDILRRLLTDGTASTHAFAFHIMHGCLLNGLIIEAMMLQKALVFAGHYCHGHGRRHLLQAYP